MIKANKLVVFIFVLTFTTNLTIFSLNIQANDTSGATKFFKPAKPVEYYDTNLTPSSAFRQERVSTKGVFFTLIKRCGQLALINIIDYISDPNNELSIMAQYADYLNSINR